MPAYSFEALDPQGQTRRGVLEADTARTARSQLRAQDLVPLKVEPVQRTSSGLNTVIWESKVFSSTALAVWTRQLSGLVSAGLPLERALAALSDEAETPRQRDLVSALRTEVNAGAPFAKALSQHPREFSAIFTAVIGAGEQSGHLGMVLERLADDLQEQQNLRGKLLAAGLYPAIVCVVALVIVLFLLAYVVPQVAQVFGSNQQQLPALTSFMLALSSFVQNFWLWGLVLVALLSAGGHVALKQADVRLRFDAMWLQLPLIGRLARGYNAARFASTLAMLATAGVPILKALQAAADTLSNTALKRDAQDALVLVREGAPLASAIAQHPRFPRLLVMFSRLGEQTGTLPTMLQRAAAQLSEEVQRRALQLATILEPLLIVAMGAMVMLIVLAVMLPIIQLNQWVR
ncbi:MAG: type II secretion system protein GspF [Burkholderiales bacterium 35-55-47]|jgi:general secretion pathway protein F|uniref:type II secretion system inner membrane protein GspF n=1 Tax=Limnohabitans sp. TaxID=1907725 RepID=UPI000BDD47F2|nr:type II secretion system inner membrane protein GspF [Limnohabitans sp.]OYY17628.1 MAG: type II secretion system protein GspF [Burkholderiales bacterium 35-55-47]OYZ72009.1 MAG: type II secretion system protein GspF [Burkholderiales bacterium 24-55-52]OZA99020.1 MAG: type II secretion system protein GspF [Burkholderiales bacterium 39-55-53]HQR86918.1 type II secretion system inner membrane protein GspF [Limnohabitans sp.]HQS26984.1 type II secretion system inner membrane protein GspF [Limno